MHYLALNLEAWNQRAEVHCESEFYEVEEFLY